MKVDEFFRYQEIVSDNKILLTFSGTFTHSFLVKIGETLKAKLAIFKVDRNTELKIFSIVIEQCQNIIFYSADHTTGNEMMGTGTITVGMENGHFFVACGNKIPNSNVEQLRSKLLPLQTMTKEELKLYYKERRRQDADADSKGAGLGFIEIARKTSRAIEFAFNRLDDKNSFFTLISTI